MGEVDKGMRDGLEFAVATLLLIGRLQVAEELLVVRVENVHELVGHRERPVPVVKLSPLLRVAIRDLGEEALRAEGRDVNEVG